MTNSKDEPISLPEDFEETMKDLLAVPPDPKDGAGRTRMEVEEEDQAASEEGSE